MKTFPVCENVISLNFSKERDAFISENKFTAVMFSSHASLYVCSGMWQIWVLVDPHFSGTSEFLNAWSLIAHWIHPNSSVNILLQLKIKQEHLIFNYNQNNVLRRIFCYHGSFIGLLSMRCYTRHGAHTMIPVFNNAGDTIKRAISVEK